MVLRISPSGPEVTNEELAGDLRYGIINDTVNAAGGVVTSWVPGNATQTLDASTTGIRISPTAPLIVRGMRLDPGQEIVVRVGRGSTQSLVFLHEDATATPSERFNNPNNAPAIFRRGEGCLIRNTEDRNNLQVIGEASSKLLAKQTVLQSATNSTNELNATGTVTFPALFLQTGLVFLFETYFEFIHTAAAVPLVDVGFSINGATPAYVSITPAANAGTFQCLLQGIARVSASGSGGSWRTNLAWKCPFGATAVDQLGGAVALPAVDTTVQNTLELRIRMQTAVASNSLNVYNGYGMMLG